ncbi:hypothetical protein SEEN4885_12404, partial [Salmonella enterica subsp. enterica serovar Newport str. WA_14885]
STFLPVLEGGSQRDVYLPDDGASTLIRTYVFA